MWRSLLLFAVLAEATCSLALWRATGTMSHRLGPQRVSRAGAFEIRACLEFTGGVGANGPPGNTPAPSSFQQAASWRIVPTLRPRSADPLPHGGSSQINGSGWRERAGGGDSGRAHGLLRFGLRKLGGRAVLQGPDAVVVCAT